MNILIENDIKNVLSSVKNDLNDVLSNCSDQINIFLETDKEICSLRHELSIEQQLDMTSPILSNIKLKGFEKYDPLRIKPNIIYYISKDMSEYNSSKHLVDLIQQINANEVIPSKIKSIDKKKIKNMIYKKGRFILVYKYSLRKVLKDKYFAIFGNEGTVVERMKQDMLILSKEIPDIIFDVDNEIFFMLNVVQSEYILNLDDLFTNSMNIIQQELKKRKIMNDKSFEEFITKVKKNKNHIRRLHKIYVGKLHEYLINGLNNNINKIERIIDKHNVGVNIDKHKKQILVNGDTDITDVLHLLSDDFFTRDISDISDRS